MSKKILVIDDDEDILEILTLILGEEGFHVIASATGREADNLSEDLPDLVLLDLRLTAIGRIGQDICAKLKRQENTKHLPVILVSSEPDIADIALTCQADSYLRKPFEIAELLKTVKSYLLT